MCCYSHNLLIDRKTIFIFACLQIETLVKNRYIMPSSISLFNPTEIIMKQNVIVGLVMLLTVVLAGLGFAYPRTVLMEDYTNYS